MNSLLLIIIGLPILEIWIMIKIGTQIGALNTILLIFLTAVLGLYFARVQGLSTIKSGFYNLYQNKIPVYEIISGASIAIASVFLIIPGFVTDFIGFVLLIPFTRKIIINYLLRNYQPKNQRNNVVDGEIIEEKETIEKKKEKDEL
jgi:UPF0716 protein FxsA|tara:strand:+ start:4155 stop:4592 length:438 start_codon:yes stop_codon:yes gene_type:complete